MDQPSPTNSMDSLDKEMLMLNDNQQEQEQEDLRKENDGIEFNMHSSTTSSSSQKHFIMLEEKNRELMDKVSSLENYVNQQQERICELKNFENERDRELVSELVTLRKACKDASDVKIELSKRLIEARNENRYLRTKLSNQSNSSNPIVSTETGERLFRTSFWQLSQEIFVYDTYNAQLVGLLKKHNNLFTQHREGLLENLKTYQTMVKGQSQNLQESFSAYCSAREYLGNSLNMKPDWSKQAKIRDSNLSKFLLTMEELEKGAADFQALVVDNESIKNRIIEISKVEEEMSSVIRLINDAKIRIEECGSALQQFNLIPEGLLSSSSSGTGESLPSEYGFVLNILFEKIKKMHKDTEVLAQEIRGFHDRSDPVFTETFTSAICALVSTRQFFQQMDASFHDLRKSTKALVQKYGDIEPLKALHSRTNEIKSRIKRLEDLKSAYVVANDVIDIEIEFDKIQNELSSLCSKQPQASNTDSLFDFPDYHLMSQVIVLPSKDVSNSNQTSEVSPQTIFPVGKPSIPARPATSISPPRDHQAKPKTLVHTAMLAGIQGFKKGTLKNASPSSSNANNSNNTTSITDKASQRKLDPSTLLSQMRKLKPQSASENNIQKSTTSSGSGGNGINKDSIIAQIASLKRVNRNEPNPRSDPEKENPSTSLAGALKARMASVRANVANGDKTNESDKVEWNM